MSKSQISVRFDPDVYAQIVARAADRDMSINEWVNRAVEFALITKMERGRFKVVTTKEIVL